MITATLSYGEAVWGSGALLAIIVLMFALWDALLDRRIVEEHPGWFDTQRMHADAMIVADGHVREAWLRVGKASLMLYAGAVAATLPNMHPTLRTYELVAAFFGIEVLLIVSALCARRDRARLINRELLEHGT